MRMVDIQCLKSQIKKIRWIVRLHSLLKFLSAIPVSDLTNIGKIRLALSVRHFTLVSYPRLSRLHELVARLEREGTDGAIVECGVFEGGTAGLMGGAFHTSSGRQFWLFDSWEGLPEPSGEDVSFRGSRPRKGLHKASMEKVRYLLFKKLGLPEDRFHLVKGWFQDTIPSVKPRIRKIALLHLDCDLYEPVKFCLEELFDLVAPNGFVVIDDYGHWHGCRKAVHEFLDARGLDVTIHATDYTGVYFQKQPS